MATQNKKQLATCPSCHKPVWEDHDYPWCIECGERFPPETQALIPKLQASKSRSAIDQDGRRREAQAPSASLVVDQTDLTTNQKVTLAARATKRYFDAYGIASSIDAQGSAIKVLAFVLATGIVLVTLFAVTQVEGKVVIAVLINGAIIAAVTWSIVHSYGVRVCAEGQNLLASLDIAVHTSPFMSDAQRAQAMRL